jgi:hypothetical protein
MANLKSTQQFRGRKKIFRLLQKSRGLTNPSNDQISTALALIYLLRKEAFSQQSLLVRSQNVF